MSKLVQVRVLLSEQDHGILKGRAEKLDIPIATYAKAVILDQIKKDDEPITDSRRRG